MNLLELKITYDNGTVSTRKVGPRVIVAFERNFKMGYGKALDERRLEHFCWLAWEAERVAGAQPPTFDDWLQTVQGVEVVTEENPPEATA